MLRITITAIIFFFTQIPLSFAQEQSPPIVVEAERIQRSSLSISREQLSEQPTYVTDDIFRQLPGFSSFRRSSSLFAHPTTAGVTLRGIRLNSTSRALVTLDGIPLNEPFGGWVYFRSVPSETLEHVKSTQGVGTQRIGPQALSGALQLVSRTERNSRFTLRGGDRKTVEAGAGKGGSTLFSNGARLHASANVQVLDTDGFYILDSTNRGIIDQQTASSSGVTRLTGDYLSPIGNRIQFLVQGFVEERKNGTILSNNNTHQLIAGIRSETPLSSGSLLDIQFSSQFSRFSNTFTSQDAERDSESLALEQFDIPARRIQSEINLHGLFHDVLNLGLHYSFISGETNENFFFREGDPQRYRRAGGEQHFFGGILESTHILSSAISLQPVLRSTWFYNTHGLREIADLTSGAFLSRESFSDSSQLLLEPALTAEWELAPQWTLEVGSGLTMRAPTLNELYRPFRVRDDITAPNETLSPERLFTNEAGLYYTSESVQVNAGLFWSNLYDGIGNVSISRGEGDIIEPCGFIPVGGICRQRRNIDRAHIFGIELALDTKLHRLAELSLRYLWKRSEIMHGPLGVVGNEFPQSPPHSASATVQMRPSEKLSALMRIEFADRQFEDDQNSLTLGSLFQVHAHSSYQLTDSLRLIATLRNLFDERAEVGKTADGLITQGEPFSFLFGIEGRT
jgi:outer membrane cobalamin receptor